MPLTLTTVASAAPRAYLRLVEASPGPRVCPPDHAHAGSCSCYVSHRCRCDACRIENTRRQREYRRQRAYGRSSHLVEMGPVREHLLMLIGTGMGYTQIARVAGVAPTGVRVAVYGRRDSGSRYGEIPHRINRSKAERLLAVTPDVRNLAGGTRISARGTVRRLQALMCLGWSQRQLAEYLDVSHANLHRLMAAELVTVRTHLQVKAVFDKLWDQLPPALTPAATITINATRQVARRRRWVPPLGWDDIDNDQAPATGDPADLIGSDLDEVAIELAVAGDRVHLTAAEFDEALRRLHRLRLPDGTIATRLHVAARTVHRARQRLQLPAAIGFDQLPVAV